MKQNEMPELTEQRGAYAKVPGLARNEAKRIARRATGCLLLLILEVLLLLQFALAISTLAPLPYSVLAPIAFIIVLALIPAAGMFLFAAVVAWYRPVLSRTREMVLRASRFISMVLIVACATIFAAATGSIAGDYWVDPRVLGVASLMSLAGSFVLIWVAGRWLDRRRESPASIE